MDQPSTLGVERALMVVAGPRADARIDPEHVDISTGGWRPGNPRVLPKFAVRHPAGL
jgi:hypothetical protein